MSRDSAYLKDFLVPAQDYLNQFEEIVTPIFALKYNLQQQNDTLQETRDLLLPRLISGEIDVSKMDIDILHSDTHKTSKYEDEQSTLSQWLDGDEEDGGRK
ncbi:MAG: hypothetical protein ACTSWA_08720 [Candidatus Thorarchaeota archaeon]